MRKLILPFILGGIVVACSDSSGVNPDSIPSAELAAVRMALDSAFLHDTALDSAFTGDSGLYALMSAVTFPFIDRASRIGQGTDTTRLTAIEFDIDATQNGAHLISNLTATIAWKGFDSTSGTVDTVWFLLGSGRAPVNDSLWTRFTLETAGTGTGFVIHQRPDSTVTKWLSRGGHLRTTASSYGAGRTLGGGGTTLTISRGTVNGELTITAKLVPDSSTTVTGATDFGSGAQALKVKIRGSL